MTAFAPAEQGTSQSTENRDSRASRSVIGIQLSVSQCARYCDSPLDEKDRVCRNQTSTESSCDCDFSEAVSAPLRRNGSSVRVFRRWRLGSDLLEVSVVDQDAAVG